MSKSIRFVNRSFKHFFIHDAEDSCDGSYQFKDGSHILSVMVISRLYKENN